MIEPLEDTKEEEPKFNITMTSKPLLVAPDSATDVNVTVPNLNNLTAEVYSGHFQVT